MYRPKKVKTYVVSEEDQASTTQSTESDDGAGTCFFEQRLEDQIEELLKSDESEGECSSGAYQQSMSRNNKLK